MLLKQYFQEVAQLSLTKKCVVNQVLQDEFNHNVTTHFINLLKNVFNAVQVMENRSVNIKDNSVDDMIFITMNCLYPKNTVEQKLRRLFQKTVNDNSYPYIVLSHNWWTSYLSYEDARFYSKEGQEDAKTFYLSLDLMSSNQRVYEN